MRRFRQFLLQDSTLNEFGFTAYGVSERSPKWGIDTSSPQSLQAKRIPAGGYQNFSQVAQQFANVDRTQDDDWNDYYALNIMVKLAENAAESIKQKKAGYVLANQRIYKYASVDEAGRKIHRLTYNDIIGGQYPHVQPQFFSRAKKMGVIYEERDYPEPGIELYTLDINKLQTALKEVKGRMISKESGRDWQIWGASQLDKLWGQFFKPSGMQWSTAASPFVRG
jgi:hypothetical protein